MKTKMIQIIKILGFGFNELIIDITIEEFIINSIEYSIEEDRIYIHLFKDDMDIEIDFDDISDKSQKIIYNKLSQLAYN